MNKILQFALLVLATFALTGCLKEVDWAPVELQFYVQDKEGNDLLDTSSSLFIGDQIVLTFGDEEYMYSPPTKVYMPHFSGLTIARQIHGGKYCATFGELNGGKNRHDDFFLKFPDGSTRKIHYDRHINQITISARKKWYLDGKKVDLPVTITY